MRHSGPSRWLIGIGAVLAVVAGACSSSKSTSSSATGGGPTTTAAAGKLNPDGTITYSLDQEATNFNVLTSDGNNFDLQQMVDRVWPTVFIPQPDATVALDKDLMVSVTQTNTSPQTIVYVINPNAVWSDGTPISADDFIYNYQAQSGLPQYKDIDGKPYSPAGTTGYSQIQSITGSPDGKTVTVVFKTPFPDWKSLFGPLAPAHVMRKIGFNTGLLATKVSPTTMISGGPFMLQSYAQGKDFIEARNPKYWGRPANLATVDYRFITDSSQIEPALANNEINASYPQPQLDLVNQLKSVPNLKQDERPGLGFEHLDFNQANPFLADVNLRKAIAMSIDRAGLIARTAGQFSPGLKPDENRFYVPSQPEYKDTSGGAYDKADVAGAKTLLTSHGYTLSGTTLTKAGKPVTLRITSTQGNALRQSEEQVVVNDLAQIGIKVNEVDTTHLGKTLASGDFDMIIFEWVETPFASGNDATYQTQSADGSIGGSNYDKYSDPKVDALIAKADNALDPAQQASYYNQADALIWQDMATLPLFQKPTLLVYQNKYVNLVNNITSYGPPYNQDAWGVSAAGA